MTTLRATARLQLHAGFTLQDACGQVPYYAGLGISHFYVSPISCARPGSTHGYDVIDHSVVSPELGGEQALQALVGRLREYGMGLILDIVPNHMATHPQNAWWWDVLQHGQQSTYAYWLDIDWQVPDDSLAGKMLAPFLDKPYGQALVGGDIRLVFEDIARVFQVDACGARYPLAPGTLHFESMDPSQVLSLHDSRQALGRGRLHELLERQHYRLSWWRCAADTINWRRFFEISELIGVRVERQDVFDAVHALPLRLFAEGLIDGLRVDHVDGLAEPVSYCQQLSLALKQRVAGRPAASGQNAPWLVVEKILADGETLDERWQVDGTSGYDFMDQVAAVLHDPAGEPLLTAHWAALAHDSRPVAAFVDDARRLLLQYHFAAERKSLLRVLSRLALTSVYTRDWSSEAIARVLDELLVMFPVYRSYIQLSGQNDASTNSHALQSEAIRRFQQLTPPLAAKSLEDTVFYRYGRLLSRNEVGSNPALFAISPDEFHQRNLWRVAHAPLSLLATATHDHKRGEDVRARLAVLSEMPQLWTQISQRWLQWPGNGLPMVDAVQESERYMLLQTLVGAWPLELSAHDSAGVQRYAERVVQWQTKALREAKIHSGWFEPSLDYEQQSADFIYDLMPGEPGHGLLCDIEQFVKQIAPAGAVNSLAQILLRVCSPGVPDLYQGTEFWDFSLVDPDNRRDVDYAARQAGLTALDTDTCIPALVAGWKSGRLKQAVLARSLALRRDISDVFTYGDYFCLPVLGAKQQHVLAFVRTSGGRHVVVLAPRLCSQGVASPVSHGLPLIDPSFWGDTTVVLPRRYIGADLYDVLGGRRHRSSPQGLLRLSHVLCDLPLALLLAD